MLTNIRTLPIRSRGFCVLIIISIFFCLWISNIFSDNKKSPPLVFNSETNDRERREPFFTPYHPSVEIDTPYVFSSSQHKNQSRTLSTDVIVFLVSSYTGDIRLAYDPYPKLLRKIRELDERFADQATTDVIIFHTGYPFRRNHIPIIESTERHVQFINIDHVFYRFSPGFSPHNIDPLWTQKGKWNYQQMCYFWFKTIFQLKVLRSYRYMMRLDDDSGLIAKWPNLFKIIADRRALYLANGREIDFAYVLPGLMLLRNLTLNFVAQHRIQPKNPEMFADFFNHTIQLPNFWNNLELLDLHFMQQTDAVAFINTVDQSQGIFLYRWGDAPLRFIMFAMFADRSQIVHRKELKLEYCHPC